MEDRIKMAVIAGASRAIKFKEKNPNASEEETLKHIAKEMDSILSKIDK